MLFLKNATIQKIETHADKTLGVKLFLRELPPEEMGLLMSAYMAGHEGVEIDEVRTDSLKTPSERLRSVLFILWEKTTKEKNFETFYIEHMEKIIGMIKKKLD